MAPGTVLSTVKKKTVSHLSGASKYAFFVTQPVARSLTKTLPLLIYRVSQKEWTKRRESVPYVKIYRYNPKHLYPKLNGYGDNGQRNLKI